MASSQGQLSAAQIESDFQPHQTQREPVVYSSAIDSMQPKRLLSPAPIDFIPRRASSSLSLARTSLAPTIDVSGVGRCEIDISERDHAPTTPKKSTMPLYGLSLQLSTRDTDSQANVNKVDVKTPLTPNMESTISYGSPASVLPRRSRGLDFSRAATHLHHSTLAEQSEPESSPIAGGRGISVPRRTANLTFDSPMRTNTSSSVIEQSNISSSVGSVSMLDSDSNSSSDDDVAMRDEDETITVTPQAGRSNNTVGMIASSAFQSPGGEALSPFTTAATNFMNYREKLRSRGRRKDSNSNKQRASSGWRYDLLSSPSYSSPPIHRSIEGSENYFQREISRRSLQNRRESLSLGTDELTIDDPMQSADENRIAVEPLVTAPASNAEERRNVIKRAVATRRSHLIPKSKGFARIRAALAEESAPIDVENRREAEVIRQVKERDERPALEDASAPAPSQPTTTASSPSLAPVVLGQGDSPPDDMSINTDETQANTRRSSSSFSQQALRLGGGQEFWNRFLDDDHMRTPPPPLFPRGSSSVSAVSEDAATPLETASTNTFVAPISGPGHYVPYSQARNHSPMRGRSSTPTTAIQTEWNKKALGKRRRDDELDTEFFKRRAVSPGLSSITGSPILPPSPAPKETTFWSMGKGSSDVGKKEVPACNVSVERVGSGSSESGKVGTGNRGVERRIGMQGMNEAGEGMMNMSIE